MLEHMRMAVKALDKRLLDPSLLGGRERSVLANSKLLQEIESPYRHKLEAFPAPLGQWSSRMILALGTPQM